RGAARRDRARARGRSAAAPDGRADRVARSGAPHGAGRARAAARRPEPHDPRRDARRRLRARLRDARAAHGSRGRRRGHVGVVRTSIRQQSRRPLIVAAALGTIVSASLGWMWFRWSYFDPDTASYLFQARLFAQGRLSAPAPPDPGFASSG